MNPRVFLPRQWLRWPAAALLIACAAMVKPSWSLQQSAPAEAKDAMPQGPPRQWAEAAAGAQASIIQSQGTAPLRYRQRKFDAKGDTTREIIETKDGSVARLVERDGKPITAADDALERDRLNAVLASPEDFLKHHKRDNATREDVLGLVRLLPQAMIYTYTPGQPQQKNAEGQQVVLDFHPAPSFKPPSMMAELLTGLEGRIWIDRRTRIVTRVEARVLHPVNLGFGVVAKIFPGGTVELEQTRGVGERWIYSHLEEHLTVRLLMVRTMPENAVITSSDFRLMPSPVSFQEGIHMLLAMPLTLR